MASSDVSQVTNHFSTANEGFSTTLSSTIASGATTVPLASTTGLTNATIFVGIIELGTSKQQVFTGTVDVSGSQITGVKWTRGSNIEHVAGVTIVDYVSGTAHNMMTKGLLVGHNQDGTHKAFNPKITASIQDSNGNEAIKITATSSAVNELTVVNSATGNPVQIQTSGDDTDIDIDIVPKGSGIIKLDGYPATGAWQTWSPSYTDLTIGNGTVSARYMRLGNTVWFSWIFTLGSTSALHASNIPDISLPVTAKDVGTFTDSLGSGAAIAILGSSYTLYDKSANASFTNASNFAIYLLNSTTFSFPGTVNATNPFTWATGDVMAAFGMYEAA